MTMHFCMAGTMNHVKPKCVCVIVCVFKLACQCDKRYTTIRKNKYILSTDMCVDTYSQWHSVCGTTSRAAARERSCPQYLCIYTLMGIWPSRIQDDCHQSYPFTFLVDKPCFDFSSSNHHPVRGEVPGNPRKSLPGLNFHGTIYASDSVITPYGA